MGPKFGHPLWPRMKAVMGPQSLYTPNETGNSKTESGRKGMVYPGYGRKVCIGGAFGGHHEQKELAPANYFEDVPNQNSKTRGGGGGDRGHLTRWIGQNHCDGFKTNEPYCGLVGPKYFEPYCGWTKCAREALNPRVSSFPAARPQYGTPS